ncbi:MAG: hypothetical protein AABW67_02420 [Nanoarchaeota archaeon]
MKKTTKQSLNKEEIKDIKIALENVKQGKVSSIGQVAKELGIILKKFHSKN